MIALPQRIPPPLLPVIVQPVMVASLHQIPPPYSAVFPVIVQSVMVGEEFSSLLIPPPAVLSAIVQFVMVGEEL
jgi:hypothetical protein